MMADILARFILINGGNIMKVFLVIALIIIILYLSDIATNTKE